MKGIDYRDIDERHIEAYRRRVALVETVLDESIDEADRIEVRRYVEEHGVSERTIRFVDKHRVGNTQSVLDASLHEVSSYANPNTGEFLMGLFQMGWKSSNPEKGKRG